MNIYQKEKYFFALLSILIVPLSGLAIDIYSPSLPSVSEYFKIDKSWVQLTITSYMIGLGLMQFFAGGISDSFGRRKPFLIANTAFFFTSLCIPYAQDINQLLALRFIQGIAVGGTVVPMRSIIPDLFEGREFYKWMNYMVMAWSIGPIIAPAIGGFLQHYFGWKSNFYFLALYTFLSGLMIYYYVPETSKHRHVFHMMDILKRYKDIVSNSHYIRALLMNGLLYSLIILFTIVGPFLIQTKMHYSPIEFGWIALFLGLSWFFGTMTNRFIIDIPLQKKAIWCLFLLLGVVTAMLTIAVFCKMNIYTIVIPLFFINWLAGILFPNYTARAMSLFPKMTGSANALFGGCIFLITSVTSSLATCLKATTLIPFSIAYFILISACLVVTFSESYHQAARERNF